VKDDVVRLLITSGTISNATPNIASIAKVAHRVTLPMRRAQLHDAVRSAFRTEKNDLYTVTASSKSTTRTSPQNNAASSCASAIPDGTPGTSL